MLKRIFSRPYTLLVVILGLALMVPLFRRTLDWPGVYVPAAGRLAHGQDIYQAGMGFVYPPINAWLALPFYELPRVPSLLLWHVLNMAALVTLIAGAWKLAGGGQLEGLREISWREQAIFWLGLACGLPMCLDVVTNQQTDLIVAALVMLGCVGLAAGRDMRAALWFGMAAAIKCTPLLWAGYLAWRKRWTAALLVFAVAVAVNLLPDLCYPRGIANSRLQEWTSRFLLPMSERQHDFGSWACGVGGNQALAGIVQRWLAFDAVWEGHNLVGVMRDVRAGPEMLKAVSGGAALLLLAAALICTWRERRPNAIATRPPTLALDCSLIVILMVLLSPHSSRPHFCTLVLPGFCVARSALETRSRALLAVLTAALLLIASINKDLVGEWVFSWTKWHGALPGAALLLYAGCCSIRLGRIDRITDCTAPARLAAPCSISAAGSLAGS